MSCNRVWISLTSIKLLRHAQSPIDLVAVRALDGLLRHSFSTAPWNHSVRADACVEIVPQPPPLSCCLRPPLHDVVVPERRAVVAVGFLALVTFALFRLAAEDC